MRRVTTNNNQPINGTKPLDCYHNRGWVTPWEHGDKISRLLRKVNKYSIDKNNNIFFLRVHRQVQIYKCNRIIIYLQLFVILHMNCASFDIVY